MKENLINKIPNYLKTFSNDQLEVILDNALIKQVVAGAGSGKTRTMIGLLEYCLREGIVNQGRILVLSFSRKAVAELRERLSEDLRDKLEISTFHAFCLHQLKLLYPRGLKNLQILTDEMKSDFVFEYLSTPEHLLEIGGIPINLLWEDQESFAKLFPAIHKNLNITFQNYKKSNNYFEFEDLIDIILKVLTKKKKYKLINKYDLIIVDEFQDTDPRQLEFLRLMKPKKLVVVGDDWQAIYAFRGATLTPFLQFQKIFPAKIFRLGVNYRSLTSIVDMGIKVIRASNKQLPKKVSASRKLENTPPVISLELNLDETSNFYNIIQEFQNRKNKNIEYQILSRTNWQCEFWQKLNFPKENTMTIHKSKGLEFPIVFLDIMGGWTRRESSVQKANNINEKIKTLLKKKDTTNWDEEIRVLYVGASRAMNLLVILHANSDASGIKESYFYEKLFYPKSKKCTVENLDSYLELVNNL